MPLAETFLRSGKVRDLYAVGYDRLLLVASDRPDYWSLYIYLAVVTAAAFALARLRMWRWLAIAAIAMSVAWTFRSGHVAGATPVGMLHDPRVCLCRNSPTSPPSC